jgi:glucose-1-phosphate thymidylyltransferase
VLGNGESFGLKCLHYRYQSEPRGIADALGLAEEWAGDDPITVLLGDNVFEKTCGEAVKEFESNPHGAVIFGTRVEHPEHYGVIMQNAEGKVTGIVEKPKNPESNLIATGLYMYDHSVWEFIKSLTPSARGELEITDVNNHYLTKGELRMVELQGYWADCGESIEGYFEACVKVRDFAR